MLNILVTVINSAEDGSMDIASKPTKKGDKGVVMEGRLADWYAKNTGAALAGFENDARRVAARLRSGARVLEIAPGPGYRDRPRQTGGLRHRRARHQPLVR